MLSIWKIETDRQKPLPRTLQQVLNYDEEDLLEISEVLTDDNDNSRRYAQLKKKLRQQSNI